MNQPPYQFSQLSGLSYIRSTAAGGAQQPANNIMQNISKTADSTNSRGVNNFVGNGIGGGSNNNVRGGQQHQEENESFTKPRREAGATQNDSFRKGESPHNRDAALNSKSKKAQAGSLGGQKDNNSLGGINIGNYAPGLSGLKMQQKGSSNSSAGSNQISSNFNDISAGFRMMTQQNQQQNQSASSQPGVFRSGPIRATAFDSQFQNFQLTNGGLGG